jgi:Rieske Fe-S protein
MLVGFGRRAWAKLQDSSLRFAPLSRPVRVPLDAVAVPWQQAPFTAEAMAPATAKTPSRRVLISGVVLRRPNRESQPLTALCLTCPHEQCKVDLVTDLSRLGTLTGGTATHPLFECGCHASVFDPVQDGARLAGETPRGLYRFRITSITDTEVEIGEIEEIALFEV